MREPTLLERVLTGLVAVLLRLGLEEWAGAPSPQVCAAIAQRERLERLCGERPEWWRRREERT